MKVVLIGYMGSGKTTLGKLLAKELGLQFIDLDTRIEDVSKKSIKDIFSDRGEIFFRKTEHAVLKKVLEEEDGFILSTGGGTPCYSGNMDLILENTNDSIYLQLSISSLADRIKNEKEDRPLVNHLSTSDLPEFIGKHLFERSPYYARAKHIVQADGKTVDELLTKLKQKLL